VPARFGRTLLGPSDQGAAQCRGESVGDLGGAEPHCVDEVEDLAWVEEDVPEEQRLVAESRQLQNLPRLRLAEGLRYTPFAAGEVIRRQGNQAHWLYLILESTAQVSVRGESGQQRVVAQLKAGDVFGEMALLTSAPRSATVTASSDVECYRLDKDVFQEVLRARRWPRTWPRSWRSATA
jgi:Cyclic nucleotide-binding domain